MWFVLSLMAFVCAMLINALVVRWLSSISPATCFLLIGSFLGVGLLALLMTFTTPVLEAATSLLVYATLCEFYLFVMSVVGTSIAARMIQIIGARPTTEADIAATMDESALLEVRFRRLMERGLIQPKPDGSYAVTAKGQKTAAAANLARKFFGHSIDSA